MSFILPFIFSLFFFVSLSAFFPCLLFSLKIKTRRAQNELIDQLCFDFYENGWDMNLFVRVFFFIFFYVFSFSAGMFLFRVFVLIF